jgi:hypothetical protein
MVEPCDYEFEMIKVSGRTFRVPVQNNKAVGKVIEQTTPVMPTSKDRSN